MVPHSSSTRAKKWELSDLKKTKEFQREATLGGWGGGSAALSADTFASLIANNQQKSVFFVNAFPVVHVFS